LGSAVDEAGITRELEAMSAAGIGGVEITAIYGVKGQEHRDVAYLSARWLELLAHTCREAARLDMGVDLPPGSGWRCGGPHTDEASAARRFGVREVAEDGRSRPVLAPESGFEDTKRAGLGGAGKVIDMFDHEAVREYMSRFTDTVTAAVPPGAIRCQFHDSWEYTADWSRRLPEFFAARRGYDVRDVLGALTDEPTAELDADVVQRVRYDYRLTLEEMLLENFAGPWNEICHAAGMRTRNQAHGSPGNLLDIYAAVDIPETEIYRDKVSPFINKFASSAGHVAGRPLISSESYTWLSDHFQSDLGKIRKYTDFLFLSGINHILFHGTAYSPADAAWPGWLFYASTQVNPRNPIWRDLPALNSYIGRCQSLLQAGAPDNDVLLYWPLADTFMRAPGRKVTFHIDGDRWSAGAALLTHAEQLWEHGFLFDYVSDRQLQGSAAVAGNAVRTAGGRSYRAIVVPECEYMPAATAQALAGMAERGVPVLCGGGAPAAWDVPGLAALERRRAELAAAVTALTRADGFLATSDIPAALEQRGVQPESLQVGTGLRCVRRRLADGAPIYFLANRTEQVFDDWIAPCKMGAGALLLDPWGGRAGSPATDAAGRCRLQLGPYESAFLVRRETASPDSEAWEYEALDRAGAVSVEGRWALSFVAGGPVLPAAFEIDGLRSITELGEPELTRFAGAVRYEIAFARAELPDRGTYALELGEVLGSARAVLNGVALGVRVMQPFRFTFTRDLLEDGNELAIEVTVLAANRIRDLDRRGVEWRIFHDINFIPLGGGAFDASDWPIRPGGLLGPVRIVPFRPADTRMEDDAPRSRRLPPSPGSWGQSSDLLFGGS